MSRKFNPRILILTLILTLLTLSSFLSLLNVNGQENKSVNINQQFHMLERSFIQNGHQNADSFDITFPSSLWTVKSVELNFTDIQFAPKTEIYEDTTNGSSYHIWEQNPVQNLYAVAVQINLTNPTTIYGAYIYANTSVTTVETIKVQIRGYDTTFNQPNGSIYASSDFNVSVSTKWYWQDFQVSLSKGSYFLVINGSSISSINSDFYWYSNDENPIDPNLKVLEYKNSWTDGLSGIPMFKILQKPNVPIYPEDISMEVKIDQNNFAISNGPSEGKGYLKLSGLNYYPNSDFLNLSVFNNVSNTLLFNASSTIELEKLLPSPANLKVTENQPNQWTLTPTILRTSDNCCVQFEYPRNWENISIYKNDIDVTFQMFIDEGSNNLIIINKTISETSDWEIRATSPLINFDLNVPKTEFELGDELIFALAGTPLNGNYTFILYDITDVALEPILKQIPPDNEGFSFSIPPNFHEGSYRAVVFWNNGTDGGVQSQLFSFVLPPPITPDNTLAIIIGLIIGISSVAAIFAFVGYKKISKKRDYKLETILTKCVDVSNINLIIITDKNSGIDLFSISYSGKKVEPTLVSGFLQAIRNFGTEISADSQDSRTIKLEYEDSILLMNEFVNLRVIISMKDNPSKNFMYAVDDLAYDIYKNYGEEIDRFRGNVKKFRGIDQLIEQHLGVSFILPMKVIVSDDQKLTLAEKNMVDKALNLMKDNDMDTIYSLYLLPENECSPKDYRTIKNLIEKGVFKPLNDFKDSI